MTPMTLSDAFSRGAASLLVICDVRAWRTPRGDAAAAIPPAAVARHGANEYVFVLQPDQTIELRLVRTGPAAGALASVYGVHVGETIVYNAQRSTSGAAVSKAVIGRY
jgi:hypothetical protein